MKKLDGLTVMLRYQEGIFIDGITRGDGRMVNLYMRTYDTVHSQRELPERLPYLEVRGEVYMSMQRLKSKSLTGKRRPPISNSQKSCSRYFKTAGSSNC